MSAATKLVKVIKCPSIPNWRCVKRWYFIGKATLQMHNGFAWRYSKFNLIILTLFIYWVSSRSLKTKGKRALS